MNKTRNCEITIKANSADYAYRMYPYYGVIPDEYSANFPTGGCCDADNNLYVITRNPTYAIIQLDSDGNFRRTFGAGLFEMLHSIFLTPSGTFLCADCQHQVIREIDSLGNLIRDIGTLDTPGDSGADKDILARWQREGLMADPFVQLDSSWAFVEGMRTIKKAGTPFNRPTDAVMAPNGDIYVSDGYANAAAHRFASDGKWKNTWGGPGIEAGKFFVPHGIWADTRNHIWVADREGNSIQVFDEDGTLLMYMQEDFYQPADIWGDANAIYVGERGGGITIFDLDLNIKGRIGFWLSRLRTHGLCGDSKGNLYLFPFPIYTNESNFIVKLERI